MANSKKTILIIEDETSLQDALRDALSRKGFVCIGASDGESGLHTALTDKPDLIMLDLMMPKMDGMQMLKKLREDVWGKNVRVLILTNLSADNSDRVRAIVETAPDFYLVKSDWSIMDIVKKTEEMLAQ
jgi:DNA-binding response OmpR family regulator